MLNLMKADLQRIFRGKGIYITLGAFLTLILTVTIVFSVVGGLDIADTQSMRVNFGLNVVEADDFILEMIPITGATIPFQMMVSVNGLFPFILVMVVLLVGVDFASGTVKNVLASGVCRVKYYVSKLILAWLFCALLYSLYVMIPTILVALIRGLGDRFNWALITSIMGPFLIQLSTLLAITSVAVFLMFTTKKIATTTGLYLGFLLVPPAIFSVLIVINERLVGWIYHDLTLGNEAIADFPNLASGSIARLFITGLVYILASTIGGLLLFKKSEIR